VLDEAGGSDVAGVINHTISKIQRKHMDEKTPSAKPTAASLKTELRESLEILIKDFESLKRFVAEVTSDGISAPIALTKDDLDDLVSVTLEIRDAAGNIEFEANKIREMLDRFVA
jgi:hypothetical protein